MNIKAAIEKPVGLCKKPENQLIGKNVSKSPNLGIVANFMKRNVPNHTRNILSAKSYHKKDKKCGFQAVSKGYRKNFFDVNTEDINQKKSRKKLPRN